MIAQISIYLSPTGELRAEAPGRNGSRQRIDLPFDFAQRNPELITELQLQRDEERARAQAKLREVQGRNFQYVAERHSIDFASQVWNGSANAFAQALKRHQRGEAGNHDGERSAKPAKPSTSTVAIDRSISIDML